MSSFRAAFRETLREVFSEKAALTLLVGGVLIYSFFYPAPYAHEVASQLPIVIVDLDQSPMSRALIRKTLAVRAVFSLESGVSLKQAEGVVERGKARGILLIPADFQRDILRGGRGEVALFGDGARLGDAGTALAGMADAIAGFGRDAVLAQARFAGLPAEAPLHVIQRPLFNTREGYGGSVVPAASGIIIHQILLMGIVLLIGARQESGRLALRLSQLLGVVAGFEVIGLAQYLYYNGFVFWFQDYPRAGNFKGMMVTGALMITATVVFALFVGSFFRVRERAVMILSLTSVPLFFLANVSWPKPSSPVALTWIARLLPSTSGITAMVKFNQLAARFPEVAPELANLAFLVLLYGGLAAWRFRPGRRQAA